MQNGVWKTTKKTIDNFLRSSALRLHESRMILLSFSKLINANRLHIILCFLSKQCDSELYGVSVVIIVVNNPYLKGFCICEIFRYEFFRKGRFRRHHKDVGWVKSHTDLNWLLLRGFAFCQLLKVVLVVFIWKQPGQQEQQELCYGVGEQFMVHSFPASLWKWPLDIPKDGRSQVTRVTMYPFCQAEEQKGSKPLIINTLTIHYSFPYHFVFK